MRHDTLGRRGDRKIHQFSSKYTTAPNLKKKVTLGGEMAISPLLKSTKNVGVLLNGMPVWHLVAKKGLSFPFLLPDRICSPDFYFLTDAKMPTNRDFEISPAKWEASMTVKRSKF